MGLRLVVLALTTILGLGCFVFDELDAAQALMDKPGFSDKQQQKKKKPDPAPQSEAAPEKSHADRPSVGDWWKKTRSLTSGEVSDEIVRCELGGATQFMRRPNCLARGGTPRQAGG
jgi:hypothetical protein